MIWILAGILWGLAIGQALWLAWDVWHEKRRKAELERSSSVGERQR